MSETDSLLPTEVREQPPEMEQPSAPRKLRRFFLRHVPMAVGSIVVLLVLVISGVYLMMSSARFEGMVRRRLINELQQATGGRAEIASFHWKLLQLEAEADGLVIHGRELQSEVPLGQIDRLRARVNLLGLWSPSVILRELDIAHPVFHLIVYQDGSTNLPRPARPANPNPHPIDTLFDLKAGHISLEQGYIEFENRASSFDSQNRNAPLNLQANDVSIQLRQISASNQEPESYRIEAAPAATRGPRGRARGKPTPFPLLEKHD